MELDPDAPTARKDGPRRRFDEISLALVFLTRLPGVRTDWSRPLMSAAWAFPVAGAVVGLVGGGVAALLATLGAPPLLAATLGVAAAVLFTGALHEDGLADTADGIGSGRDRARSLEILRDSRIGAYGVLALIVSSLARVTALAALLEAGAWTAALPAFVLAAALGRGAGPAVMAALPPARDDGVGAAAGRPAPAGVAVALVLPLLAGLLVGGWPALPLALAPLVWLGWLALRRLGGTTGDVVGAAILLTETTALALLAMAWGGAA
ncbi:adenosylcobinamide-GDP ribazoletransferase [Rhodospira trueperi]|uniref:Adenosylcobinamide-GDP ribazoletransferase n=1 Tax=Rhodospira trueperi TaxID=69960 RepID=A0A1G7FG34_9PROT|nr:adenosylcobinamide-GDP ribazoletransferase [Rhodospira trueperi]SDE74903.1 adenosylcobinamide-GDP ribazoletransferase [Rhodospira trueperi]